MNENIRLPKIAIPHRYEINLDINLDAFSYTGKEVVFLEIVDETKELLKKMGHKKLTVDLQEEVKEIPSSLEKYNLEIGKDKISIDYTYNVQAKQTGITNLLQDLKDAGFKLKDLKTEQSTLEKIFVSLVKENKNV